MIWVFYPVIGSHSYYPIGTCLIYLPTCLPKSQVIRHLNLKFIVWHYNRLNQTAFFRCTKQAGKPVTVHEIGSFLYLSEGRSKRIVSYPVDIITPLAGKELRYSVCGSR